MVDFSFSSQKVWNLDVSISSRIMRFVCKISLSLLETRENIFGFLFSSRNWRKYLKFLHFFAKVLVLFSNQETDLDISLFSSRNSRCGFHISLSLLDLTFLALVNHWDACGYLTHKFWTTMDSWDWSTVLYSESESPAKNWVEMVWWPVNSAYTWKNFVTYKE